MPDQPGAVVLAWYFHLPTVCTDDEVLDLSRRSILPLLRTHERERQPVVLAITGALLSRLRTIDAEAVDAIHLLIREELCEIAATCTHEVFPAFIPRRLLRRQVIDDVALKTELFPSPPKIFFPPNFAWVSAFESILSTVGVDTVLIDAAHFELAASPQSWRWHANEIAAPRSELLDPEVDVRERSRLLRVTGLHGSQGDGFRCLVRDNRAVQELSFGTRGAIHHTDPTLVDQVVTDVVAAAARGWTLTFADDGDRINPMSLNGYHRFLRALPIGVCARSIDLVTTIGPPIEYLPSFAITGFEELLREGLDSTHYLRLLDELYNARGAPAHEQEIMALQDIFFLFWKTVSRKRAYMARVMALLDLLEASATGRA